MDIMENVPDYALVLRLLARPMQRLWDSDVGRVERASRDRTSAAMLAGQSGHLRRDLPKTGIRGNAPHWIAPGSLVSLAKLATTPSARFARIFR
jgi:hypothetical protein